MLSGFTSQIGTFIGKKTGGAAATEPNPNEQQPQEPTSLAPETTASTTTDLNKDVPVSEQAPAGSETSNPANILSSVRNHIPSFPSWLGGAKKPEAEDTSVAPTTSTATPKVEDATSATGGAETDPQQVSEEEAGAAGPGNIEKVKNLGLSIFSAVRGAGQKIKETSILGDFQREHDSFLKSKSGKSNDNALAPWVGHVKEEALKEEILSLSNDRRNFVRCPPPGINFAWDWAEAAPVAAAILKDDPNLENMRYTLVPKVITEENFWRNYFYRVQLLKESMDDTKPKNRRGSSSSDDGGEDADLEKELNEELKSYEFVSGDSKHDEKEIDSLLDLK